MATTPKHLLPYPAATDPAYLGASNIQQLAERVDAAFGTSIAHSSPVGSALDDSQGALVAGTPKVVVFTNGLTVSTPDWALSTDKKTFTYTGPDRYFLVSGRASLHVGSVTDASLSVAVTVNGAQVANDAPSVGIVADKAGTPGAGTVSLDLSGKPGPVPVLLHSGDTVQMTVQTNRATGNISWVGLTILGLAGALS